MKSGARKTGGKVFRMKNLTDIEVHEETLKASAREKSATLVLLEYLAEMERRRAYLARGYSSLWNYVEKGLGYSPAQTGERISALRLMKAVPEVRESVESGKLSLTTAAALGQFMKREKKTVSEIQSILPEVENKSSREVERMLLPETTAPKPDRIKPVSKTTTQITIEVDEEFMALLKRAEEIAGSSAKETLKKTLQAYIRSKRPEPRRAAHPAPEVEAEVSPPQGRYIPAQERRLVRKRSGDQCEHRDKITGRRCDARRFLEFHHCDPYAYGGAHSVRNMKHLCHAHHRALSNSAPAAGTSTPRFDRATG